VELRALEYFVVVAEERNFTRAAARLHVVQSGVSATIKALERELGAELLARTSRRVELTDAGAALLPRARAALEAVQAARDAVDEARGGLRGTLRIGTMTSVGLVDLPALLGDFHRRYPNVSVRLAAAPSGSGGLVTALAEGTLDLALVSIPGQQPAGVELTELTSTQLDLVVRVDHRLAGQAEVTLADIADEPFVDFPVGYGNRTVTDRAFAAAGLHRQVAIEIVDIATGVDYVRHCLGVALLPRFIIRPHRDITRLLVTGSDVRWPMSVATSTRRSPNAATRALLALLAGAGTGTGSSP
jgi:DNA-binding transcriptional LysR family regulator